MGPCEEPCGTIYTGHPLSTALHRIESIRSAGPAVASFFPMADSTDVKDEKHVETNTALNLVHEAEAESSIIDEAERKKLLRKIDFWLLSTLCLTYALYVIPG
jgi:hypothetical protein